MSESNRKPIIAAIVCAAVALLVWGTGMAAGGGNSSGSDGWQQTLSDMRRGQALQPQDLQLVAGSCLTSGSALTVQGACTFSVEKFGGPFDLGPPTKEAKLMVLSGSVHLELVIEGVSATSNLAAGKHAQLTFGTSGGSLSVQCASLNCVLTIVPDG